VRRLARLVAGLRAHSSQGQRNQGNRRIAWHFPVDGQNAFAELILQDRNKPAKRARQARGGLVTIEVVGKPTPKAPIRQRRSWDAVV
jgi:hypothetical protein